MDEIGERLRHSLNQAIAGEIRNNETGTMPNFDIAAFSVNFHNATDVNLVPDDDDEQYKDNNTNMEVCRLCLCSDKKLYELSPQIQVAYQCALSQDVPILLASYIVKAEQCLTTYPQMQKTDCHADHPAYHFVCCKDHDRQKSLGNRCNGKRERNFNYF